MRSEEFWKLARFVILMCSVYKNISAQNLALGKQCLQSSIFGDGEPKYEAILATDGDQRQWMTGCSIPCCTHTQIEYGSWWVVDLEDVYDIMKVLIYGRNDCCDDRLSRFYIEAIMPNSAFSCSVWSSFDQGEVSECYYQESATTYLDARCKPNTVGRFLRIRLTDQNPLVLCEVEVFGQLHNTQHLDSVLQVGKESSQVFNIRCGEVGSYYEGQLLEQHHPRSAVECLVVCTRRRDCYAANYWAVGKECDLMAKRPGGYLKYLVADPAWRVYFNP